MKQRRGRHASSGRKGTNREDFAAGRVDHYAWVGPGSSFVMPELSAAIARVQLGKLDRILEERRRVGPPVRQRVFRARA